jgi:hypothetical protein
MFLSTGNQRAIRRSDDTGLPQATVSVNSWLDLNDLLETPLTMEEMDAFLMTNTIHPSEITIQSSEIAIHSKVLYSPLRYCNFARFNEKSAEKKFFQGF